MQAVDAVATLVAVEAGELIMSATDTVAVTVSDATEGVLQ
jgi:hypothetical protein